MIFLVAQLVMVLAILFLFLGSVQDLKTGEIPEKISIGFIISMLLISTGSAVIDSNPGYLIDPLLVGAGFFLIGYVLFYLGQWGGGDVKLVAGVGLCLGYLSNYPLMPKGLFPYYATYFINLLAIAFPYATVYGVYLGSRVPETGKEFRRLLGDWKTRAAIAASFLPALLAKYYGLGSLAGIYLAVPFMFIIAFYLKAVEMKALQKTIQVKDLKLWDVVAEDLVVEGKTIASKRDIEGLTEESLMKVKKLSEEGKIGKEIRIKWGIKFAPVLLLSFISVFYGNVVELIVSAL